MIQNIDADKVWDGLWVGRCPSPSGFLETLAGRGITALLTLQTDEDLEGLGLSWPELVARAESTGLVAHRVSIEDFNKTALVESLPAAVDALQNLCRDGHVVYVHCSAGLNRSPTVVIGYLVAFGGLDLSQAWHAVTSRHRSIPYRDALERWMETRR